MRARESPGSLRVRGFFFNLSMRSKVVGGVPLEYPEMIYGELRLALFVILRLPRRRPAPR